MPQIRLLSSDDAPRLERFLARHSDSSLFLRSNLRAVGVIDDGRPYSGTWVAASEGDELVGVACHAWQGNLLLQAPAALDPIVRFLGAHARRPIAGILGPHDQVVAARAALGRAQAPAQFEAREVLFALDLSALRLPEPLVQGRWRVRPVRAEEGPIVTRFRHDFLAESLHEAPGAALLDKAREVAERDMREDRVRVLEVDGQLVASASLNAQLPDTVQVGGVWTPPDRRGRGYARAVVAGLLAEAHRGGVSRAVLFTDEDKVPAIRAYEAIGFRVVGDYALVVFG